MRDLGSCYIAGEWRASSSGRVWDVIDPATEARVAGFVLAGRADAQAAVAAAAQAQQSHGRSTRQERLDLLERVLHEYTRREAELAELVCAEIGAPLAYARESQVPIARRHLQGTIEALRTYEFERRQKSTCIAREPIGVSALITPWNFPLGTAVSKIGAALAAGCCVVFKPSEFTPFSALALTEIFAAAGVPPGVLNLVIGLGEEVGEALAAHPEVRMLSITGSTAAGIRVAQTGAQTVKRVHQELGGKSANLLLEDADLEVAVPRSIVAAFRNSGQSCSAPTRLLVPRRKLAQVEEIATAVVSEMKCGHPRDAATTHGPVINQRQFERIQAFIAAGMGEGAKLIAGGPGRPEGLQAGYFVRPTVFSEVSETMRIAQEEIFGPVLPIIPYDSEEDAIRIANGTPYGLAAYVQSQDLETARRVARRLEAGTVHLNFPAFDSQAPFGGWKQSGNGREYGSFGIDEFSEIKSITGCYPV